MKNTIALLQIALFVCVAFIEVACSRPDPNTQDRMTGNRSQSTPAPATATSETGFVYTANERGNSISVIDLSTGQVKDIATRITPHNVQVLRDSRLLLAIGPVASMTANQPQMKMNDDGEMARGRLLILDAETLAFASAADIEIGRHPAHVIIDAQGKLAYATNSEDNNVLVIDVARKTVVGEVKTGKFPHGLRMSPTGREIYVANVNDNSVSVIDITQSKEVTRIPVGKAPVQVGFTPDGRRVYVSLRDENSVAVIDAAQRKKIATVAVGRNPIQVFATPDGRYIYVANQGTETNPDNTVSVIDTANNSVVATIETGKGAHGVVVSDDGRRAFVANIVDSTVSVIDTATQKVTRNIKVGKGPNGITFRSANR
jgi:YVTN family beta-propeller protein